MLRRSLFTLRLDKIKTTPPHTDFLTLEILYAAIYCVSYVHCQLQLPTTPPPFCPSSPPPSSLIEILPGTQTLPILGTKLGEREGERKHTGTSTVRLVPHPLCLPSIHSVLWTKGPGNPIGISLLLHPAKTCSNSEEFCWQLTVLRVCSGIC